MTEAERAQHEVEPGVAGPIERILDNSLGLLVGASLFSMMALTFVDVTLRYIFNAPIPGAAEVSELLMGLTIFGAIPSITARSGNVTIDLFDKYFTGRFRQVQESIVNVICALIVGMLAWRIWVKATEIASYGDRTSYLDIPLAPMAYFMSAMAILTAAILLILAWQWLTGRRR